MPRDEPSMLLDESIPLERSHSHTAPSKSPAIASEMALPTTAPASAPAMPKSSAPITAGIIRNKLSIMPKIISGRIFFKLILKIKATSNGSNPKAKIIRLTNLPRLIEKNATITVIMHRNVTMLISSSLLLFFFTAVSKLVNNS